MRRDSDGGAAGSGKSGESALPPQPVSVAVCGRRLVAGATPASAMRRDRGQLYPEARLYRELVRCEMFRHTVFQGEQRPGFLLPQPVWVESLLAALACHDDTGEVDKHRNTALEAITDTGGQWNGGAFDWASDSDSRLGPVLELVTGGVYIWLPFSQIRSLESPQPTRLTDLLWKPINITLMNGDTHGARLFTRYSGSESASDALRLCRNRPAGRPRRNHRAGAGAESVADQPRRYQPAGHGPLYLSCSGKRWRMSTSRLHPLTTCCPPYLIGCVTMLRIRKLTGISASRRYN